MQKKVLQPELFARYESTSTGKFFVDIILELINKPNLKICDVGGATGLLLNEVIKKSKHIIEASILEIDDYYKNKTVNEDIKFIQGSILDKKIKDNEFDIVIFRLVLHHIISNNLDTTLKIQSDALYEIFRITKKEGYIIFFEQIHQSSFFSWIIYHASKIFNKLKIRWSLFDIDNVIVHFLTYEELKDMLKMCKKKYKFKIIKKKFWYMNYTLKWKLLFFMRQMGNLYLTIKVMKD